jgi:hypothetical protein
VSLVVILGVGFGIFMYFLEDNERQKRLDEDYMERQKKKIDKP